MEKLERMAQGQEEMPWSESLTEKEELEKWQRYFSGIANVFLCAVDNGGVPLTELGGEPEQARQIEQYIDGEQFQSMLQRVSESRLEDQAVERCAWPNLLLGVATSRIQGRPVINWLICAVTAEAADAQEYENPPLEGFSTVQDESHFLRVVDTLRTLTDELLADKLIVRQTRQRYAKCLSARQEAEGKLRRSELLREMMWTLVQTKEAQDAPARILKLTGEFLTPGVAALYTKRKEQTQPQMAAKWEKDKTSEFPPQNLSVSEKTEDAEATDGIKGWPSILMVEKTLILSYNSTMSEGEQEELAALGLTGIIVIPGKVSEEEDFWFCLGEKDQGRSRDLEEIRLAGEIARILQSALKACRQAEAAAVKPVSRAGKRKKK